MGAASGKYFIACYGEAELENNSLLNLFYANISVKN